MTHKRKFFYLKFMFGSVGWPLLRAEDFFCNLDVLYGGLGIGKLWFLIQKIFFSTVIFFLFLVIEALDPDWILIGSQPKLLDPDPDEMNTDPQPCFSVAQRIF
jgi:hypothetical protein